MLLDVYPPFANVSRETHLQLVAYCELIKKWTGAINLISRADELWHRHITDALWLSILVAQDEGKKLADLGSGGGFPGIVLAICNPQFEITLIESDRRKSLFLKECKRELSLSNITILNNRIEQVAEKYEIITARALADLNKLFMFSSKLLTKNGTCYFPKGQNYDTEYKEALKHWSFEYDAIKIEENEGAILKIRKIEKREI